jgi:hypothetical protein
MFEFVKKTIGWFSPRRHFWSPSIDIEIENDIKFDYQKNDRHLDLQPLGFILGINDYDFIFLVLPKLYVSF